MTTHLYINAQWLPGHGPACSRADPTDHRIIWHAPAASVEQVHHAIAAAKAAAPAWARLTVAERTKYLHAFSAAVAARSSEFLETICRETGKPRWESRTEVDALQKKVALTLQAHAQRRSDSAATKDNLTSATRYKPLGALAVLGPFNLPAHLPNGQILPALLAGNTVVFKPSELTPGVGALYTECWEQAALPVGVFNLIHGGRDQGAALAAHPDITGIFFTGSHAGGIALAKAAAAHPEKLLALEMGGNNPLVAANVADIDAAAYTVALSAFVTAGQRCTCARRLILLDNAEAQKILDRLLQLTEYLRVGPYHATPEPFIGPVISEPAGQHLLAAQDDLLQRGAVPLRRLQSLAARINMLSPGILDVTAVPDRPDEELFGPLLQVIRVPDVDAAITEANNTRFGLAAALLSDDRSLYERFFDRIHAGIINWNRPTTGAASDLPFGGLGASGNHRPAGFFAIDFCNDPVASLESPTLTLPATPLPGLPAKQNP